MEFRRMAIAAFKIECMRCISTRASKRSHESPSEYQPVKNRTACLSGGGRTSEERLDHLNGQITSCEDYQNVRPVGLESVSNGFQITFEFCGSGSLAGNLHNRLSLRGPKVPVNDCAVSGNGVQFQLRIAFEERPVQCPLWREFSENTVAHTVDAVQKRARRTTDGLY